MRKLIGLLTCLPILVWAEEGTGLQSQGGSNRTAGTAVAESAMSPERLLVYKRTGEWRHFAELVENDIEKYPPKYGEHTFAEAVGVVLGGDIFALNSIAWDTFRYCSDKDVLARALKWSEMAIELAQPAPNAEYPETQAYRVQFLDTKANLLYRLNRVDEAIASERLAIAEGIASAKRAGRAKGDFFDDYSATVEKMRKGEPTWPTK